MAEQHTIIVAIVTRKPEKLQGGGAPVFIVDDEEALQRTAMTLEKVMDAAAQEVNTETIVLVAR